MRNLIISTDAINKDAIALRALSIELLIALHAIKRRAACNSFSMGSDVIAIADAAIEKAANP